MNLIPANENDWCIYFELTKPAFFLKKKAGFRSINS
jgi:hypothetical protein